MSKNDSERHVDERPAPRPRSLLRLWFGWEIPVGRRDYALSGAGLMLVKYAVDAGLVYAVAGTFFSPLDYLSPLVSVRVRVLSGAPSWLSGFMLVWAVPFLWVGVSLSVRRAISAGYSPWLGTLFFVPFLNYLIFVILALLPTTEYGSDPATLAWPDEEAKVKSAVLGVLAGVALGLAMTVLTVYWFRSYGAALFFGTPFLIGALGAYVYNHRHRRDLTPTLGVSLMSLVFAGGVLLLFAFEGVLCLAMAAPIALVVGMAGSVLGWQIARLSPPRASHAAVALAALPLLAATEAALAPAPHFEVASAVEIEAPPEKVWPHVIGFAEIEEPEEWFFRAGIASPRRARIEGRGVGAVRYCEFSTGAFVEPITAWDEPARLTFDVGTQPDVMRELSPYRGVRAPHLGGALRSRRGEFRLVRLAGGRTRLEGRTWYTLEMAPQAYWALWSDAVIGRIHGRVLRHVKRLAERGA